MLFSKNNNKYKWILLNFQHTWQDILVIFQRWLVKKLLITSSTQNTFQDIRDIYQAYIQKTNLEKRGTNLLFGILIVLVFWLLCSMPTNTHTFFFRNLIDEKVTNDIATTQGYLSQIKDNTVTEAKIQARCVEVENQVNTKLQSLEAEIKNPLNPGNGPETERVLGEIAQILGVSKINKLSGVGNTVAERNTLYQAYRDVILLQLDNKKMNIIKEMQPSNDNYRKTATKGRAYKEQGKGFY